MVCFITNFVLVLFALLLSRRTKSAAHVTRLMMYGSCFTEEHASLRSRLLKGKGWGRRKISKKCGVGGGGGGGISGVVWNRTVEGPV